MGRIVYKGLPKASPVYPPHYDPSPFRRFLDKILSYGLESIGLFYGIYRAEVVSIDDPENPGQPDPQGRIQVRVPMVGDDESARKLAYPVMPFAGNGFGFKNLPSPGDQVYVVFEMGNPSMPLWLGGWWARGEIPDEDPKAFVWVTPGGMKVELHEGQDRVTVTHKNGSKVNLDADGNIQIEQSGTTVKIGSGTDESAVLGDTLLSIMSDLTDALLRLTVPTGVGPSGPPINAAEFAAIKARLIQFLSKTVRVAK